MRVRIWGNLFTSGAQPGSGASKTADSTANITHTHTHTQRERDILPSSDHGNKSFEYADDKVY